MTDTYRVPAVVCSPILGLSSEVWIDRQLQGFERLRPTAACWDNRSPSGEIRPYPVHVLPDPLREMTGSGRWGHRLAAAFGSRNFVGAWGSFRTDLARMLRVTDPRVILCHFGPTALLVLPEARRLGIPVVAHFHGHDLSSTLRHNKWYRWSLEENLHRFAAIVVVGSQQRKWMSDRGVPPERVHVIPCGAPVSYFRPPDRDAKTGNLRLVAVSRLVPWKGLDYTLRAFAEMLAIHPGSRLHIVGDGLDQPALEQLAKELGVREATVFKGAIGPAEVRKELAEADIFVQHSLDHESGWTEGFGVSITEAAAMRLPVVVSRCGGIVDQVMDGVTGVIVNQRDVAGMAEALCSLAADPGLRLRLGEEGRQRALRHFDTSVMIRRLEDVLLASAAASHQPN